MVDTWLQVAQEALKIPGLLVEIYGDLARPGVRQVGKALENVLGFGNTILWPIAWANERSRIALESNLERYRVRMEQVPQEKVIAVAPEIGVPIAEKLAYVRDEKLCDLYVQLLATASNTDTLGNAHPSFANVISNLSPDEAKLLEFFANKDELVYVLAHAVDPNDGKYNVLSGALVAGAVTEKLTFPKNVDPYLSNLAGLGLLAMRDDRWLHDPAAYEQIESVYRLAFMVQIAKDPKLKDRQLKFVNGVIYLTSFGENFIQACRSK